MHRPLLLQRLLFCCSIAQEEVLGNIEEPNINGADAVDISDKEDDTIGPHWVLTETLTAPTGISTIERSLLMPVADGILSVVPAAQAQASKNNKLSTRTTIREMGPQILITQTFDRASNKLLLLETTSVLDPLTCTTRARVSQVFDQSANGDGSSVVNVFCVTEARTSADMHLVPRSGGGARGEGTVTGRRPVPPVSY